MEWQRFFNVSSANWLKTFGHAQKKTSITKQFHDI